jgi:uncharacterized membrane protein
MSQETEEKNIKKIFDVYVLIKGLYGLIEVAGALLVYLISPAFILRVASLLTEEEISGDPHDRFANFILHSAQYYSVSARLFGALYLFIHGLIKIILVIGLLKDRKWAYPATLATLGLFIVYQLYKYIEYHSIWILALTLLDAIFLWLVWHEYKVRLSLSSKAS